MIWVRGCVSRDKWRDPVTSTWKMWVLFLRRGGSWEQVLSLMQGAMLNVTLTAPRSLSCQERLSWWMTSCPAVLLFVLLLTSALLYSLNPNHTLTLLSYPLSRLRSFWSTLVVSLLSDAQRKQGSHSWGSENEISDPLSVLTWTSPVIGPHGLRTWAITGPGVSHFPVHPSDNISGQKDFLLFFLYRPWLSVHEQACLCEPCVLLGQYVLCTASLKETWSSRPQTHSATHPSPFFLSPLWGLLTHPFTFSLPYHCRLLKFHGTQHCWLFSSTDDIDYPPTYLSLAQS